MHLMHTIITLSLTPLPPHAPPIPPPLAIRIIDHHLLSFSPDPFLPWILLAAVLVKKLTKVMEGTRRLNPDALPFYPSRSRHFKPSSGVPPPPSPSLPPHQSPSPPTWLGKSSFRFSNSLTPVPKGPRIRGGRGTPGRRFVSAGRVIGGDDGRRDGGRPLWVRKGVYREVTPLDPDENSTSIMIRNIPNNYTRELLVKLLEDHCKQENKKDENVVRSAFDFVYLPVDFKYRLNAGYAFVNFTTPDAAWRFQKSIKGKGWDLFQSKKIADVARAKIQGKDALVRNFERMQLQSPSSEYLPVWFDPPRDGSMPSSTMKMHAIGSVESW
ncbi:protein terminal ear1 [Lactuca sativa]|uniref:Mei2-like C-terminal RNA recognition motif domain-containing protein n=1 Tax=Lactuca sativa TaxID=4236 RepID=A0A9R1V4I1_LACSA|nr:protein terminal ear1 [Lactuca sativa]KAJ0198120.1 hypothetical protein LSAT_V11C700356570 [Lactuca sativa]